MTQPPVSVIIVSRGRPDALTLCLTGVARLTYPSYEVSVVADQAGLRAVERLPFADWIKTVRFDEANISAARNRGVAQAAGEVLAFLDDDAVPEPRWLDHLAAAFGDPAVAAAGGFVLGRNGISFQWKGRIVDQTGRAADVALNPRIPSVLTPPEGHGIKTEGTNMAIRRDVLAAMGGFDPAFRFYLDETDVNLRLARDGHATAIVPLAQVHHGYAASDRRGANRRVRDLRQIAASTMVFLRKHCPESRHSDLLAGFEAEQRRRLLAQMVSGLQEPRDIRRLMGTWRAGLAEGRARVLTDPIPLPPVAAAFSPFPSLFGGGHSVICGYRIHARRLRREAAREAASGKTVTLLLMSRSALYHRLRFHPDGYWEQSGGLWGRSDRSDPLLRWSTLRARCERELDRIGTVRFWDA